MNHSIPQTLRERVTNEFLTEHRDEIERRITLEVQKQNIRQVAHDLARMVRMCPTNKDTNYRILAIKILRTSFDLPLKDAKDAFERADTELSKERLVANMMNEDLPF